MCKSNFGRTAYENPDINLQFLISWLNSVVVIRHGLTPTWTLWGSLGLRLIWFDEERFHEEKIAHYLHHNASLFIQCPGPFVFNIKKVDLLLTSFAYYAYCFWIPYFIFSFLIGSRLKGNAHPFSLWIRSLHFSMHPGDRFVMFMIVHVTCHS